jgi:hypothetical protein
MISMSGLASGDSPDGLSQDTRHLSRSLLYGFRERSRGLVIRRYDLHLFPVVGKLFTAIETHYIRTGCYRCARTALSRTSRNRETVILVPATEEHVREFSQHKHPHRTPQTQTQGRSVSSCFTYLDSATLNLVSYRRK